MATVETDWAAVRESIRAWVESLSGLQTYWRNDNPPHPNHSAPAMFLLELTTLEERGLQVVSYEASGTAGSKVAVPRTDRLLRATLDVSCQAGWFVPGQLAMDYLARAQLRTELQAELGLGDQLDSCTAFVSAGPISTITFEQDRWLLSQATSQWILNIRDTYQDTDVSTEAIEAVSGFAALSGVIPDIDV